MAEIPEWLNDPVVKRSVVAREIGLTPTTFQNKLDGRNGNRLTEKDLERLESVRERLIKLFTV